MTTYSTVGKVRTILQTVAERHGFPDVTVHAELDTPADGTATLAVNGTYNQKKHNDVEGQAGAYLAGVVAGMGLGKYARDVKPPRYEEAADEWFSIKFASFADLAKSLNALTNRQELKLDVPEPAQAPHRQ